MTFTERAYTILPYRFMRFGMDRLLVNEAGEFSFISENDFTRLRQYQLDIKDELFLNLKNRHIVADTDPALPIYLLSTKYRTKKSFLNDFTALHIFIITLRCNQKCKYCQASSEEETRTEYDMSIETAKKSVDLVFKSPSPALKIEFQGGEPFLNIETVKYVVQYAEKLNRVYRKNLEFVICTNLLGLNDNILNYLQEQKIWISTSLDGPRNLHDANRINRKGSGTYDIVRKNIQLAQDKIGNERISALMVTTRDNVDKLNDVVDEYIDQRFNSIFIRTIHPFGRAVKEKLGYDMDNFIKNYEKTLDYIIKINLDGLSFSEQYATIILNKILTPFATSYVDLQSPAGTGISCAVYGYNGDVFVSDEARMLSKMGDNQFLMGNVHINSYQEIFHGKVIRETIENSCVETMPLCSECAFQMYCGADPVRNYSVQGDLMGHRPTSEFHQINYQIIRHLLELIKKNDRDIMNVFWSWITNRPIEEIVRSKRE
ncbi:MAG: His-Xaa-Ser system radical SAM maturase HxsB [bacterium]|nr:His-Xaa-Ser system radical SAM maturase HxsB [bacterium]